MPLESTGEYMNKGNLYGPLVKALSLPSQNCINQALVCLQNLINDGTALLFVMCVDSCFLQSPPLIA